jgi:hypothetical protein
MSSVIIYKNLEKYCSFPSIIKIENNHLLVAYRIAGERSNKAGKENVVTHHDPDSSIALIESYDNGNTWPKESFRIIYKAQDYQGVNDPALTILNNGDLILRIAVLDIIESAERNNINGILASHRPEHGLVASIVGNYILKSENKGKKWEELVSPYSPGLSKTCSREPVIELEDNTLLLSSYCGAPHRTDESLLFRSYDNGRTWGDKSLIASDTKGYLGQHYGINYNETALLNLGNGELVAMIRADSSFHSDEGKPMRVGGIGELLISRSFDSGLSWFPPKSTGIWGQPAHLLKLSDGRIICTYGYRKKPYGIRAVLSEDRGCTWSDPIIIHEGAPSWDIGYPSSVELSQGSILSCYYYHDQDGIRYIAGTHWTVK